MSIVSKVIYSLLMCSLVGSCSLGYNGKNAGEQSKVSLPLIDLVDGLNLNSIDLQLSDAASLVEIIPLETSKSCLISSIETMYLTDEDIIVQDSYSRVLRFNRQGKFLNEIGKRGNGPGEFTSIHKCVVDPHGKQVYALPPAGGSFVYDFNGVFLQNYPEFEIVSFLSQFKDAYYLFDSKWYVQQSGQLLKTNNSQNDLWSLATLDANFKLNKLFFNPAHIGHEEEILSLTVSEQDVNNWNETEPSVSIFDHEMYLKYADVDTIYQYDKSQEVFIPLYSLNLGKYKGNDYMGQNMFYKERRVFDNLYIPSVYFAGGNMYLVGNMGENVYEFQYNRSNGALLMNKRPQPVEVPSRARPNFLRMSRDFILRNDITGGQFMVNHITEDSWIFEVSMETIEKGLLDDLKSGAVLDEKGRERLEEFVSSMDDDHNPVLVIAKLK